MKRIYMDNAATTATDEAVLEAMLPFFRESFGNASSLHTFGQEAKKAVEMARERISTLVRSSPEEIVFTSGGTESDNFAIKGVALASREKGDHIITSAIEHHAVLESCHFLEKEGFRVTILPVDEAGLVDPSDVAKAISDKTILISIMHANNEIGTIEPIEDIGALARSRGVAFHTDAVQTFGRIPINVEEMNVDLLSASGHKLYGPKGVGIMYIRKGTRIASFMHGGEQEKGRRASTLNVPGIVGMGKAAELALANMESEAVRLAALRDRMIQGILEGIEHSRLNGHNEKRLPNNINISLEYVEGESLLLSLDMEGIACSTGSACSSLSLEPSHVLRAIGLPHEIAHGSLRFSLGRDTTQEDVDRVLAVLKDITGRLRAISPMYNKKY